MEERNRRTALPAHDENEEGTLALADDRLVSIRPIRPTDAAALQAFHRTLSSRSVYLRFFGLVPELSDERADYFTHLDGVNRFALVALDPEAPDAIIAVVRFDREAGTDRAEYAAAVSDRWQGHGLGLALTRRLVRAALRRGVHCFFANVLPENARMLHLFRGLGLPERSTWDGSSVRIEIDLTPMQPG